MNPAMPRITNRPTRKSGMARTMSSLRSTKLPSIRGFIMAANSGSVAAKISIPKMESAKIRQ